MRNPDYPTFLQNDEGLPLCTPGAYFQNECEKLFGKNVSVADYRIIVTNKVQYITMIIFFLFFFYLLKDLLDA